ncbi:MAG: hypothetical protein ACOYLT_08380 [Flavobacterium sp.]|uniref:hypothetical protein n=1 Tax=Flavobacterium sp. TaxID=239 RepID=UPI003BD7776F
MKTVVFTLCSNNYLAHAKTLGDSIREMCPETDFIIGLVDDFDPAIDYTFFSPYEIIKYDQIGFDCFEDMLSKYNIIEFNTAVKPYYFGYLFQKYGAETKIYYVDPDIVFYKNMDVLNGILDKHAVVLTPMLTKPNDEVTTDELVAMRHGMYNLGFIGARYCEETLQFMKWWQQRLRHHCVIDKPRGLFVDQKWIDIAPLFFEGIYIFKHLGYNMAWWNFAERRLKTLNNDYFVNDTSQELVFFHFSGYKIGSLYYTGRVEKKEYLLETLPELQILFADYSERLKKNNVEKLSVVKPLLNFASFKKNPKKSLIKRVKSRLFKR